MANLESVRGIQHQYTVMSPQMMHTALADSMQHLAPVSLSNHVLCTPTQQMNQSIDRLRTLTAQDHWIKQKRIPVP